MSDPTFHFFDDAFPDGHPLANEPVIYCVQCGTMCACHNEFMCAFFNTGVGIVCFDCVYGRYSQVQWHINDADGFEALEIKNV